MDIHFGIVEDINDPLESGRVRVRAFGVHSAKKIDVPTDKLKWAQCMTGAYESSFSGVGKSPTGIQVGQTVILIFLDRFMQIPLVLGAVSGINEDTVLKIMGSEVPRDSEAYGFAQNVKDEYLNEPDTNMQARTDKVHPHHSSRSQTKGKKPNGGSFEEPASTMSDSVYPHSKVIESPTGHLVEMDDTPGNERLLIHHKNGTFQEMRNDGMITKVQGEDYNITIGNKYVHAEGDVNVSVAGNCNLYAKVSVIMESPKIDIGTDSPEPMVLGDKLAAWITNELKLQFDTHTHIGNLGAPTSPPLLPLQPGTAMVGGLVYSKKNRTQK